MRTSQNLSMVALFAFIIAFSAVIGFLVLVNSESSAEPALALGAHLDPTTEGDATAVLLNEHELWAAKLEEQLRSDDLTVEQRKVIGEDLAYTQQLVEEIRASQANPPEPKGPPPFEKEDRSHIDAIAPEGCGQLPQLQPNTLEFHACFNGNDDATGADYAFYIGFDQAAERKGESPVAVAYLRWAIRSDEPTGALVSLPENLAKFAGNLVITDFDSKNETVTLGTPESREAATVGLADPRITETKVTTTQNE